MKEIQSRQLVLLHELIRLKAIAIKERGGTNPKTNEEIREYVNQVKELFPEVWNQTEK